MATQLRRDATGEADSVLAGHRSRVRCHGENRCLGELLNRTCEVSLALGEFAAEREWGAAEEAGEPLGAERIVAPASDDRLVDGQRAVVMEFDELANRVGESRFAERCEPHELVLTVVRLEPAPPCRQRVEEAERVGVPLLGQEADPVVHTVPDGGGGPLADSVDGEDRRRPEGGRQECCAGVAEVVLAVDDGWRRAAPEVSKHGLDAVSHHEVPAQQGRHLADERRNTSGAAALTCGKHTTGDHEGLLVEHDDIDVVRVGPGDGEAGRDRVRRSDASCLIRVNRSSSAAASTVPSLMTAAAASW